MATVTSLTDHRLPRFPGFTRATDYEGEPLNFLESPTVHVPGTGLHTQTTYEQPYGFLIALGDQRGIRLEDLSLEDALALADALSAAVAAARIGV